MTDVNQAKLLREFLKRLSEMTSAERELTIITFRLGEFATAERIFKNGLKPPPAPKPIISQTPTLDKMGFEIGKD